MPYNLFIMLLFCFQFYNAILEQFISTWYNKITLQPFFVDELRYQLRYASASLLRRALKVSYFYNNTYSHT